MTRRAYVHRLSAKAPDDVSGFEAGIKDGTIEADCVVAVFGKTEGNGLVNDFSRGFATRALQDALRAHREDGDADEACIVMSGGTEGALAPHFLVFEVRESGRPETAGALAVGRARTPPLPYEHLGRLAQVDAVAEGVRAAIDDAGIEAAEEVHFVQIKCPLLTVDRVTETEGRGRTTATRDTLKSMSLSRAASALGVAVALGEVDRERLTEEAIGRDWSLFSSRASTSAGVELADHEIVALGTAPGWSGPLRIGHAVMADGDRHRAGPRGAGRSRSRRARPVGRRAAKSRSGDARQGGGGVDGHAQGLSAHHVERFRHFLHAPRARLRRRRVGGPRRARRDLRLRRRRAPGSGRRRPGRDHRDRGAIDSRGQNMTDAQTLAKAPGSTRGPSLETIGMTKNFGRFTALDNVSVNVPAGTFHALLGENGAGKSTLVKCVMGFYSPDKGTLKLNGKVEDVKNPRDAQALGVGMVYQHFTLVPSLTAAENLVASRADAPAVIPWRKERERLEAFLAKMPFRVPLDRPVSSLAAGEKQKLEILKLLYLDQRFLILDEPTSVLTPGEADEILGLLKAMAHRGEITALMITHKFREVDAFCDDVSVLRRGAKVGGGKVGQLTTREMAAMMIGDAVVRPSAARVDKGKQAKVLEIAGLFVENDEGRDAVAGFDLTVRAGEIVGIAGVSGNGQSQLVEALSGQRPIKLGQVLVHDQDFEPKRDHFDKFKVFGLPEEPLKNATAPTMSVAENMAFRAFDKPPIASLGWWLSPGPMRTRARELIAKYNVKTVSPDAPIRDLSGGNVQRAVLARELSNDVDVLIVANPCFGLDFVSVADIRAQIMEQRNRGAAVLLVSEDLDEILELSDRVAVISEGKVAYLTDGAGADRTTIGRHMAGH